MFRKISTILLSFVLVWYAAVQTDEEKPQKNENEGIEVYAPLYDERQTVEGEEIYGQVRLTAALQSLSKETTVRVDFVLESRENIYRQSVEIMPDSWDEKDYLSATAVFSDLRSGLYTAYIEHADGALLDYILLEKGDGPEYRLNRKEITFEIRHSARLGSARFILKEIV